LSTFFYRNKKYRINFFSNPLCRCLIASHGKSIKINCPNEPFFCCFFCSHQLLRGMAKHIMNFHLISYIINELSSTQLYYGKKATEKNNNRKCKFEKQVRKKKKQTFDQRTKNWQNEENPFVNPHFSRANHFYV
jgi:hypothetical protein